MGLHQQSNFRRSGRRQCGSTTLQYALVVGLVALGAIATVTGLGDTVTTAIDRSCLADSAAGGWTHRDLAHGGSTQGLRGVNEPQTQPADAIAWRTEATITCTNGLATASAVRTVPMACAAPKVVQSEACADPPPENCAIGTTAGGFRLRQILVHTLTRTLSSDLTLVTSPPASPPPNATAGTATAAATCNDGALSLGPISFTVTACAAGLSPSPDQSACVSDTVVITDGTGAFAGAKLLSDGSTLDSCQAYRSHPDYLTSLPGSGLYWVDPNGDDPATAIQVQCEMISDGGTGYARCFSIGCTEVIYETAGDTLGAGIARIGERYVGARSADLWSGSPTEIRAFSTWWNSFQDNANYAHFNLGDSSGASGSQDADHIFLGSTGGAVTNETVSLFESYIEGGFGAAYYATTDTGWRHVLLNYDAAGSRYVLYLDGVETPLTQWPGASSAANQPLRVYDNEDSLVIIGSAFVDQVVAFNRSLTADEIRVLATDDP